jgi:hypothetical protein
MLGRPPCGRCAPEPLPLPELPLAKGCTCSFTCEAQSRSAGFRHLLSHSWLRSSCLLDPHLLDERLDSACHQGRPHPRPWATCCPCASGVVGLLLSSNKCLGVRALGSPAVHPVQPLAATGYCGVHSHLREALAGTLQIPLTNKTRHSTPSPSTTAFGLLATSLSRTPGAASATWWPMGGRDKKTGPHRSPVSHHFNARLHRASSVSSWC